VCDLETSRIGAPYIYIYIYIYDISRLRVNASSHVKSFSFITLSTCFSHYIWGRPRRCLPPGDQSIIRLGHITYFNKS